jgi:glutathione peroxidase
MEDLIETQVTKSPGESRTAAAPANPGEIYGIPFRKADGSETDLGAYRGNVLLVVNVASKCGLTPQYDALEKLHEGLSDRGFSVLGFPANEFAGQEPGTDEDIQQFCRLSYGVTFPVFAKIAVKGEARHQLYDALIAARPVALPQPGGTLRANLAKHGLLGGKADDIMWNFEKFLVGRNGEVVARFAPDVTPEDPVILAAIEAELAKR